MVDGGLLLKARDLLIGSNYHHCSDVADGLLSGAGLSNGPSPLNLGNLTGPFVIILVGYALAILTLIIEQIIHFISQAREEIVLI